MRSSRAITHKLQTFTHYSRQHLMNILCFAWRLCQNTSLAWDLESPSSQISHRSSSRTCEYDQIPSLSSVTQVVYSQLERKKTRFQQNSLTWFRPTLLCLKSNSYITNRQINVMSKIHVSNEKKGREPMSFSSSAEWLWPQHCAELWPPICFCYIRTFVTSFLQHCQTQKKKRGFHCAAPPSICPDMSLSMLMLNKPLIWACLNVCLCSVIQQ